MLKPGTWRWIAVMSLLLPSIALSQPQEAKNYKIIKGDTLWDISNKELSDPFLWPKIWKENPGIKNPDRLYPGQKITIPWYLLQKPVEETTAPAFQKEHVITKPAELTQAPAPAGLPPLIDLGTLMSSGYIAEKVSGIGMVEGAPTGRQLFGNNDLIFLRVEKLVKTGDKFYIIRPFNLVIHPVTHQPAGHIVQILGTAEIIKIEYGQVLARINKAFAEISTGDLLDIYYTITPPNAAQRTPNINGIILAMKDQRILGNLLDIVYLDKGKKDGVEVGDMFKTLSVGKFVIQNGIIQIINTRETNSTAVIRQNSDPIVPGDLFFHLN